MSSLAGPLAGRLSAAQWYCALAGLVLAVRGATTLPMADFGTPGDGWHAAFHLVSGLVLLGCAALGRTVALRGVAGFGLLYGAIVVAGLTGDTALGLFAVDGMDTAIHSVYVVLAAVAVAGSRRG